MSGNYGSTSGYNRGSTTGYVINSSEWGATLMFFVESEIYTEVTYYRYCKRELRTEYVYEE